MTERRAHWSDELIEAVGELIYNDYEGEDLVCAVIAFVEDWQAVTVVPTEVFKSRVESFKLKGRLGEAEAQVRAVRELWTSCDCDRCTSNRLAVAYALDNPEGDDDNDGAP